MAASATAADPLPEDYDYRAMRSNKIAELAEACARAEIECARRLEAEYSSVEKWLADEQWLLDRYRSFIAMTEFREAHGP